MVSAKAGTQLQSVRSDSPFAMMVALWQLGKPRINAFLILSAFCAMVAASHGLPPLRPALMGLLGLALTCAGAAMINMWFDRDIDQQMERTQNRPLPRGVVSHRVALGTGLALGVFGVGFLYLMVNPLSAALALAGYVYYAVVYTMWLKRRTPQNIVIGGGAGAIPPLVGWAAVTGHLAPLAWMMFLVTFLWTPSHFWGLALYKVEDYIRANVPMMPAVRGYRATVSQMLMYALLLSAVGIACYRYVVHPWSYFVVAVLLNAGFAALHVRLVLGHDDRRESAMRTFFASLVYLPFALTAIALANV